MPGSESGACWLVPCSPRPPPFAPPTPTSVARRRSPASQLLWRGLTSHARASPASAHHLPDADQGATALARREISRFPDKERTHMLGSTTAPGRPGARDDAPGHVAFRSKHSVGDPGVVFSRLNTQPMRTPVNASPTPSRVSAHDSGTVWFARPSLEETCTLYSLPVSRRTHCQLKQWWYASSVGGERLGIWKRKACLLSCPEIGGQGGRRQARLVNVTLPDRGIVMALGGSGGLRSAKRGSFRV